MNVSISGVSDASATTDASGRYSFTGLRMGNYSVEISGFDSDAVGFSSTASSTSVGVGESKIVSFDGTYLRTAGVSGQVSVEGEGLNGVMVSLRGGPDNVDESTTTDAAGQYAFASLRAGTYTVGISGWDDTDFEFEVTSKSVTVALGETGYVEFEGELLRTSGLAGRVSVGGMGIAGVTVTLSGTADATANTNASGQYGISGLAAGDYTVTISGYDAVEYSFDDSQDVTLEMDQTTILNFDGMALRTASIKVMVTADGAGVAGVAATLTLVTGATSGTILSGAPTGADGSYTFGPLLAGNYRVDISGFDAEIDFAGGTNWQGQVATGAMAEANFAGMINRTGSIAGMVTADGEGMGGVTVTLGGAGDASMMTADDGSYSFTGLRRGDYTVSVTNPNADMYSFPTTSRAVSVAIGQAHTDVSFAGTMIRRSSISGQVSVEGMGLEGVMVTLSGAHDATAETDGSGQYAFAGLGSGMYTVSMANPNDVAYAFETMSADIELGNSGSATQNFTGMHTRTASISGMLYVDEAEKNDMYDDGEDMLAAAGVELALIGPSIAERQTGSTGDDGSFSFGELRAGSYQLVVSANAEVPMDYGYGGPATGYDVMVDAGEAAMQNVPFDITHTTVSFSVMLKSGDDTGDALPGAMVTLYSDDDGDDMVGEGETDEMGMASIRFAREGTSGNMVYAMVASDDYMVDDDAGMQAVMWDPTSTMADASNAADITNMKVDVTVSGATITTEYGGGDALAGWAIGVTMGTGDDAKAVEGDHVPEMLDDDGMASFMTTVESVPATFTFSVADDQDEKMDGDEKYEGTDVEYTHDGLSLMGTMDAGTIEVKYTTQTLKVYVHHEKDQIMGYTGNILGGDARMSGKIHVSIRHIDDAGRSRSFDPKVWKDDRLAPGQTVWDDKGVVTFRGVPASANVIVQAAKANSSDNIKLLDSDELATYTARETNGVMRGAFGAMGGYSHMVELCPLTSEEHLQGGGECGSFAFVTTHNVKGLVWKQGVSTNTDDFDEPKTVFVDGIAVSLDPVKDKNLAGTSHSQTTTKTNVRATAWNDTHQFDFGQIADGVYDIGVPPGWRVKLATTVAADSFDGIMGSDSDVGRALNPLASDVGLDVTPATATVYGIVHTGTEDDLGFGRDSVTVKVNGVTATTDHVGRYIAEGVMPETRVINRVTHTNSIFVETAHKGHTPTLEILDFRENRVTRQDIPLSGVAATTTVTGTVTLANSGAPIAGAEIMVDGVAPLNKATRGVYNGKLVTGTDGTYSAVFPSKALGLTADVSVQKDGVTFLYSLPVQAHSGATPTADFEGYTNATITGTVTAVGGGPMAGVLVSATGVGETAVADSMTTGRSGTFTLSPGAFGTFVISASANNFSFAYPARGKNVAVGPGLQYGFGNIEAQTFMAGNIRAMRVLDEEQGDSVYTGNVRVTWTEGTVPEGQNVTYQVQHNSGGSWEDHGTAVSSGDVNADPATDSLVANAAIAGSDDEFMVRIVATSDNGTSSDDTDDMSVTSDTVTVGAIDPSASGVKAARSAAASASDSVTVTWSAETNSNSQQRVVVQFSDGNWYVAAEGEPFTIGHGTRSWKIDITALSANTSWNRVDGNSTHVVNAELLKAIMVAVESVQGTESDKNPWKRSTAAGVSAKPSG